MLVRVSDQSIINPQDTLMQILLVACFNIVLFTITHTVTNIMSAHRPSADERLRSPTLVPRSRLVRLLVTRPRNSQQTIRRTVIRGNRGGTSTAKK